MSDNIKSFIGKNRSVIKLVLIFAVGILLVALSGTQGAPKQQESSADSELATLCSAVSGVGECEVMITYGEGGEVMAVAVICEGADLATVRAALTDMIGSLYGIGANRISILKSK